ncbi:MAG: hypothetical protein OEZ43_20115 [Gammaproteobacteria bacterium]|nr:hypothetical protein [Gammaproteobacteria bacterium]
MKACGRILIALLLVGVNPVYAYYYAGISADAIYSFESDKTQGDAQGLSADVMLGYGVDRFFTSLKLGVGGEVFSGSSDASQDVNGFEIISGYRVTPMLSAYVGYRFRNFDFMRRGANQLAATEQFNHYGIGGSINYPLDKQWLLRADVFAYYLTNYYESDTLSNSGSGYSGGTSLGTLYRWRDGVNFSLSYRLQFTRADYFTGGALDSIDTGLSIGVTKIF